MEKSWSTRHWWFSGKISLATREAWVRFLVSAFLFFYYGFSYSMQGKYRKERYKLSDIIIENVICDNPSLNYNYFPGRNQRAWDEY